MIIISDRHSVISKIYQDNNMNYSIKQIAGIILILLASNVLAQDYPLILDKQGTFKILDWGVYDHYDCGFSKAETNANYLKLVELTDAIRGNPVLQTMKGFDSQARLYAMYCDKKSGYGIPSQISLEFCYYYLNKGKEEKAVIEPPNWYIQVNKLTSGMAHGFNYTAHPSGKAKPGFDPAKWETVASKVKEIFFTPGEKENLAPGIDRYAKETVIIYNPSRPAYWIPVTIGEAFGLLLDYWKMEPDHVLSDMMLEMIENEYSQFSESERDGNAYGAGGQDSRGVFSRIGTDNTQSPLMRVNPEYWNKKLPRSAIQILSFNLLYDKDRYKREAEEGLKYNSGGYHVSRFLEALEIKTLLPVIDQ